MALAVGYTALAVWLTWPLASMLATALPCTDSYTCQFDTVFSAWAASWVSHALATAPLHVGSANIYYPSSNALYYGPAALGAVPYALPVFLATGNAAMATNAAFLASIVLTALATHWVVWRWTDSHPAGFVSAWAFLMNRWFLWGFVAVTPHLAAVQYLPLIAFLAARRLSTVRQAIVLMGLVTLQCLTDPVYVAVAVLLPLWALALSRIARPAWRRSGWWLAAVLAGSLAVLLPLLAAYARARAMEPLLAKQSAWGSSAMLYAAFAGLPPNDLSALLWRGDAPTTIAPAILGIILTGVVVAAVRGWRGQWSGLGHAWRHAGLWAFVGTWLSLSPVATIGNPSATAWQFRLPQYVLVPFGFYQVVRVPERLGVVGMIGLCLLAGVAFAETMRALAAASFGRRWLSSAAALALAVLAYYVPPGEREALPSSYPVREVPSTGARVVNALRAGHGPVLELPTIPLRSNRPAPHLHVAGMYRSTLHWRPLLNGYSSYWPAGFAERMRLAALLPASWALRALVCETGVRTIVVDLNGIPNRAAWLDARIKPLEGLRLAASAQGLMVFEVTIPAPGQPGAPACPPATIQTPDRARVMERRPPAPRHDAARSARSGGVRWWHPSPHPRSHSDARRACPSGSTPGKRASAPRPPRTA